MVKIFLDGKLTQWKHYDPIAGADKYAISVLRNCDGDFPAAVERLDAESQIETDKDDPFANLGERDSMCAAEAKKWLLDNLCRISVEYWDENHQNAYHYEASLMDLLDKKEQIVWDDFREKLNRVYVHHADEFFREFTPYTAKQLATMGYSPAKWWGEIPIQSKDEFRKLLHQCDVGADVINWVRQEAEKTAAEKLGNDIYVN